MRTLAVLLALVWGLAPVAWGEPAAELGLIHVEGNVGGASGGHVALRLGDLVYHRQLGSDQVFRLERETWTLFSFRYGTLHNRPMHVGYVALPAAVHQRAGAHFAATYLRQRRRLETLDRARRNRELVEALLGERAGVPARGAGLLDPARSGDPWARELRARVESALGPEFLADEVLQIESDLRAPLSAAAGPAAEREEPGRLARYREKLLLRDALVALAQARGLDERVVLDPSQGDPDDPRLLPAEVRSLERLASSLERAVLELLESPRPDRAFPLLVAVARYQVARRSLDAGRPLFLDPFPDEVRTVEERTVRERREEFAAMAAITRTSYRRARRRILATEELNELRYNRLELSAAEALEYSRGAREGRAVRETGGHPIPQRERALEPLTLAGPTPGLRETLARAQSRERALAARVRSEYGYDLVERNCVTELLRELQVALGGPEPAARALGGRLDPGERLGFIPFVFFDQVQSRLRLTRSERIPNYRERRLVAEYARGGRLGVYLREVNSLTSRIYERRDRDGSFLLFSDDVLWPRPLYGAVNLAWALADGSVGVLTAPFDRGRRVKRAAVGAAFSFPELLFMNVRKGSFDAASLPTE
jgi:hypothetical protein